MLLEPSLARHPRTTFVLFHVGYPWYDAVAGLAHSYPNVIVDLVWVPLLTVSGAAAALHELLDVARSNERIGWGGDARTAEEAFGALLAWRHVVATVLAEKIDAGMLRPSDTEPLARKLLYANVEKLYGFT
jgi:predicted TIM-barrel fold metal-dependent hydrolase